MPVPSAEVFDRLRKLAAKKLAPYAGTLAPVLQALKAEETAKILELTRDLDKLLTFKLHQPSV